MPAPEVQSRQATDHGGKDDGEKSAYIKQQQDLAHQVRGCQHQRDGKGEDNIATHGTLLCFAHAFSVHFKTPHTSLTSFLPQPATARKPAQVLDRPRPVAPGRWWLR